MKLKSHVLALAATAAVGIAGVVTQVVVAAPERPAALQALEKQGVTIVGTQLKKTFSTIGTKLTAAN